MKTKVLLLLATMALCVGTPEAPFLIDLKGITGLFGTQAGTQKTGTYDVLGRRLPEGHHLPQGVYIINGKKVVR